MYTPSKPHPSRVVLTALVSVIIMPWTVCARADLIDFSPDGRQIAYRWFRGLVITSLEGGGETSVAGADKVVYAQWSPTGRHLAYLNLSEAGLELAIYNTATKKSRGIGAGFTPPFAWREDGNRFACVREIRIGKYEMVWYNLVENGTSFRVPMPMPVDAGAPMVWLPNTDDLAFVAGDHNVYTLESGEFKKVTTSGDVLGLSLYAAGKKLVWARRSVNLRYILMSAYAYDLTARNVVRLGFPDRVAAINPNPRTAPESVDRAVFSPDGARILLYTTQSGAKGRFMTLYSVSMDGRSARQVQRIPSLPATETINTAWSHDGKTIAVLYKTKTDQKLFVTLADGSGGRVVRSDRLP